VVGAVAQFFFEWEWWDFVMALSSLAFVLALISALCRKKPATSDLPDPGVSAAKRPGF
jgi:hypothetical protein